MKYAIVAIFATVFILSCNRHETFDSEKELWVYLNDIDNEYKQSKNINNIEFSLLYS